MNTGYDEGYSVGINWTDSYRPGGPWHSYPQPNDSPKHRQMFQESVNTWNNWHAGFDAAMAKRGITDFIRS